MSAQEPTFVWEETPEHLVVTFPPPPGEEMPSVGCATTFLALLIFMTATLVLIVLLSLWGPRRHDLALIAFHVVLIAACAWMIRYARTTLRRARQAPVEPASSVLGVRNGVLTIERVGRKRDMDVSWELTEIADIRLCPAAPDKVFLGMKSLLKQAISPDMIRISIQRHTGDIDDILLHSPGRFWTDSLETRLRGYLGLS